MYSTGYNFYARSSLRILEGVHAMVTTASRNPTVPPGATRVLMAAWGERKLCSPRLYYGGRGDNEWSERVGYMRVSQLHSQCTVECQIIHPFGIAI